MLKMFAFAGLTQNQEYFIQMQTFARAITSPWCKRPTKKILQVLRPPMRTALQFWSDGLRQKTFHRSWCRGHVIKLS